MEKANLTDDDEDQQQKKKGNPLPLWGNAQTMNMNNMIVTNVLSSPYFKNDLFKLKTFHEVVDEIYYKVEHLEPWERGSRKTHGQVGMCGGVRGVGAGGIVSTPFCLLFKLFTLKLTEKQLLQLLNHPDSPYIRAMGFMYIRYCVDPKKLWYWYEPYLEDEEEIDPKAGTGSSMTIGQMVRSFLLKLDWYGTLFPRIPVPVHKDIEQKLKERNLFDDRRRKASDVAEEPERSKPDLEVEEKNGDAEDHFGEAERYARLRREGERKTSGDPNRQRSQSGGPGKEPDKERTRERSKEPDKERTRERSKERERDRKHRDGKREGSRDAGKSSDRHREGRHREDRHRDDSKRRKGSSPRRSSRRSRSRSPKRRSRSR